MPIHPLAYVDPSAQLGRDVHVGPFAIIEAGAKIGDRCVLEAYSVIKSGTTLGDDNRIFERATIGGTPQHLKAPEHIGEVVIGCGNIIRESVTIHRALHQGQATTIGDHNFIMVGTHIAHDCLIGNHVIFANNATLGGHVVVDDRAYLSGNVAIHQFCRIGSFAMVAAQAKTVKDVPPYVTLDGVPGHVVGLNTVGLRRNGFTTEDISQLKAAYRVIYRSGLTWQQILDRLQAEFATGAAARFTEFLPQSTRGIPQERRLPPGAAVRITEEAPETPVFRAVAG